MMQKRVIQAQKVDVQLVLVFFLVFVMTEATNFK